MMFSIMKTNQIMIQSDLRAQRTKDGYLNATKLVDAWNKSNPESEKQLSQFKMLLSTKKFIEQLKKEGIEKPMITGRGSGKNSGTWMHPKLFIDLAMWVSLEFKSMALGWIADGLIKSRHEAGDYYNEMCATILEAYVKHKKCKPPFYIYSNEANLVRNLVTDKKDRNEMTEQELNQITYLQKVNSNLISKGIGRESRLRRLSEANEIAI